MDNTGPSKLPFNININGGDPSSSLVGENSSTEYKEYIIQNNISLQQQNQKLTEKNQELSKELSEKEDELDKEDERLRYVKGILNNLNEIRKLAVDANQLQSENYQKSLGLMKRVMNVEHTVYNNLILLSRIMTGIILISFLWNIFYWRSFGNTFSMCWCACGPLFILNLKHTYFDKQEPFDIYKNGHYKLYQDLEVFKSFSDNQQQIIKDKLKDLKEIEDSNLSLDHWIAET